MELLNSDPKKKRTLKKDVEANWENIQYVAESAFYVVLGVALSATSLFSFMYADKQFEFQPLGLLVKFSGALVIFIALYCFGKGLTNRGK